MKSNSPLAASLRIATLVSCCFLVLVGCSSGTSENKQEDAAPAPAQNPTETASKTPFVPVDACSLMTKTDVEAVTGKKVLDPVKEEVANLVTCTYGDPEAPKVNGRAISAILNLNVFTGEEGAYFAGPVAQAKDAFETGRKNAASSQNVPGLGQDAYWDEILRTLHVYKDRYEVSITVESGLGLKVARSAGEKALTKLP